MCRRARRFEWEARRVLDSFASTTDRLVESSADRADISFRECGRDGATRKVQKLAEKLRIEYSPSVEVAVIGCRAGPVGVNVGTNVKNSFSTSK